MEPASEQEVLAMYIHSIWTGWMAYIFRHGPINEDGSFTIPATQVTKWKRQMDTSLVNLPEDEQTSDYAIADQILELLQ